MHATTERAHIDSNSYRGECRGATIPERGSLDERVRDVNGNKKNWPSEI